MSPQTPLSSIHARIFAAYLSTVSTLKERVDIGHIRVCINMVSNKGCFQPALYAIRWVKLFQYPYSDPWETRGSFPWSCSFLILHWFVQSRSGTKLESFVQRNLKLSISQLQIAIRG